MASHEEDTPTLVNNLVSETTPGEKKNIDRTKEDKTAEDRRELIEITDEDIEEDNLGFGFRLFPSELIQK